jgi:glycosyltransferase involved in cell wall biosynthesis
MSAFCHHHIEVPASDARLPAGEHVVRGWVWPHLGGLICDVRARVGSRTFAGVHGFPRADLAAHFQSGQPVALAGFEVVVTLAPGEAVIELEALEIEGRWSPFAILQVKIDSTQPSAEFATPRGPLNWLDYRRAIEAVLRRADGIAQPDWTALARAVVTEIPWPRDLRHAAPPFIGFVDEPVTLTCARYGRIPAFGHLFHPTEKIARVLATTDLQTWQTLDYGRPSPGPETFYAAHAHAKDCGFVGLVDVPAQLPNPVALRLYAELTDGSLHLAQVVRAALHSQEAEKAPLAATREELAVAAAALDAGLAAAGVPVHRDREIPRTLEELAGRVTRRTTRVRPTPSLRPAPLAPAQPLPRTAILATHGLSPQGAPRFLLDLARMLLRAGVAVHIVSAGDGPLRAECATLGARVTVLDLGAAFASGEFADALKAVDWSAAEVVIANTFTAFWAVHAACAAKRPSLLYIHESTTPAEFYGTRVAPFVVELAERSIELADAVSFTTAATARYHAGWQWLTPGWIDVAALDQWRASRTRSASRARFGLNEDDLLVANIGTVSDRKGQHTFARAVDLFCRRYPDLAARTRFVLLGGRDSPFDLMLGDVVRALGRSNLEVHPETTDYLDYYQAADVFACSSYEESSPRVVLEAMALNAPILASAVHGIPELVRSGSEALLVPPGDTAAWAEALGKMLISPAVGRDLAARARARVVSEFEAAAVLPRHLALIADIARKRLT